MKDTLDAYPYLSAVITMRLHANILSFAHEIPFFALSYSTKTDAILHDINHEDMLACATFHADVFQKKFSAFREALPERKLALQEKNTIMKAYLHTQLTQLFDGLESAPSKSGGPDS
jgi:polysaccharide pyruvyl transferase WcaK-like protein